MLNLDKDLEKYKKRFENLIVVSNKVSPFWGAASIMYISSLFKYYSDIIANVKSPAIFDEELKSFWSQRMKKMANPLLKKSITTYKLFMEKCSKLDMINRCARLVQKNDSRLPQLN